ncbi:MAG TPA: type VI secretion system-associated protein TagF, partial [Rhodopila sp.]|uniref:type VI secretion system-associated protein TagF n=1 Tax=Rhodopila sp. TaxID=2480087 RepID=UPI002BE17056
MPSVLRVAWEQWLSSLVVAARAALGTDWPHDWLTAPLWHFTLGREVAPPLGAAGVLLASVDRVGRFFPFSILGLAAPDAAARSADWARAAEALALSALADDFDPDRLDAALAGLGPPPAAGGAALANGIWPLRIHDDWPAPPADRLSDAAWLPPGPSQSAWWCRGSERMVPVHIRAMGLPHERLAAAMVTGVFDPADGGEAALDPGSLAIRRAPVPPADGALPEETSPDEGRVDDDPSAGRIDMDRVDPLGGDPVGGDPVGGDSLGGDRLDDDPDLD